PHQRTAPLVARRIPRAAERRHTTHAQPQLSGTFSVFVRPNHVRIKNKRTSPRRAQRARRERKSEGGTANRSDSAIRRSLPNNLFATKPLGKILAEAHTEGQHGLKRVLGPLNLIALGIGAVIGAGIFVITGQAAAQYTGPAVALSFVLAGLGCAFAGLCYAEL